MSMDAESTEKVLRLPAIEQDNGGRSAEAPSASIDACEEARVMRALRRLSAGLGHDLNDLLTVVTTNLETLRASTSTSEEQRRLIDAACEGAERAALLARQMLGCADGLGDPAQDNSLESVIRNIGGLLSNSISAELRIETALSPRTIAYCDVKQLELAILNLAMNAHEAMPGGGLLALEASEVTLEDGEVSTLGSGSYVRIAVLDTGAGMDAATLARATEPHFTTKANRRGAGLAVVEGIMSRARGALRLQSRRGVGTTAELWVPGGPCRRATDRKDSAAPLRIEEAAPPQAGNVVRFPRS